MTDRWTAHTLVFDLDDTLYPERDGVLSGFGAVDEWLQKTKNVTVVSGLARQTFEEGRRGRIFDEVLP
jgi:putative hydrolase of the HAD superfamily